MLGFVFAAALAADASVWAQLANEQQALFEKVAPSVVFILNEGQQASGSPEEDKRSIGSGFFVTKWGLILTNAHVVRDTTRVTVVTLAGKRLNGKVIERATKEVDLALIRVDEPEAKPLELGTPEQVRIGNIVGAIGHGMGGIWTFNTGIITNNYSVKDAAVFQTQIPINSGNSGGPVFDSQGRVLGVVTAQLSGANLVNFAIRADMAALYLPSFAKYTGSFITVNAPKDVPVLVDGTLIGRGPRVMVPVKKGRYEISALIAGRLVKKTANLPDDLVVDLK